MREREEGEQEREGKKGEECQEILAELLLASQRDKGRKGEGRRARELTNRST